VKIVASTVLLQYFDIPALRWASPRSTQTGRPREIVGVSDMTSFMIWLEYHLQLPNNSRSEVEVSAFAPPG